MRPRPRAIATLVLALVLLPASPALAGGNWLDFRKERPVGTQAPQDAGGRGLGTWGVVHIGQRIVAIGTSWPRTDHRRERLAAGTFYAWLVPGDEFLEENEAMPADAVRLAPFTVRWAHGRAIAIARAHITVPSVSPGGYSVLVCDDPCTLSGLGDYVQGWITITRTPMEARLLGRSRAQTNRIRNLSSRLAHVQERTAELELGLQRARGVLRGALPNASDATTPIELRAPRADVREAGPPAADGTRTWWIAFLAVAVGSALGFAIGRKRRRPPAIVVPDTVPDDLLEREPVLRR